MKTCLTCGASVAEDADVCPDCGMEFESQSATPMPASTPAASNDGAGFTVDFGAQSDDTSADNPAPIELDKSDFEFDSIDDSASAPVVLEKADAAPIAPTPGASQAPVSSAAMAHLTLRRGGALTSESFRFGSGAVVGRFDPDSGPVDVDLAPLPEASYVSRHHAEFRRDGGNGQWFVKDMGSSNGTFWRAGGAGAFSRLSGEQQVNAGDEISLGNARFEFGTD